MNRDPRPQKQIEWLKDRYELDIVCKIRNTSQDVNFINYPSELFYKSKFRMALLMLHLFEKYVWNKNHKKLVEELSRQKYDLIIAHHIKLLPLIFYFSKDAKVILDAHEYYTEQNNDKLYWRFFMKRYYQWLSNNFIHKCNLTIAVNQSMEEMYKTNFNVKTTFITNAANFEEHSPKQVDPSNIKIIHHGLASSSRKLELMIELMYHLDERYSLTFLLLEINKLGTLYVKKLKKMAKKHPRIKFIEPIPQTELISYGNNFDIGLFFMPPSNINEEYSLANKFFQFVQSRLMLAISPLPEMKRITEQYNLGILGDDYNPKSLASKMNKLTAVEIFNYKINSNKYARELSAETNKVKFLSIIKDVIE